MIGAVGLVLGLLVLAVCAAPIGALMQAATPGAWAGADTAILRFTLMQAALSALLSVALAVPLARALALRRFPGRGALLTLLGAPFLLPALVAVLGLLAIWGRGGVISDWLALVGRGPLDIYGLGGILLAHVFFNLSLVTRLLLQGWAAIPAEQLRLAAGLGFRPADQFRHVEWPMLREVVPGAGLLVFLLCTTSFAIALTLGGGPGSTTVEVAIYQAIRFEFDLGRAGLLALVQTGLCLCLAGLLMLAGRPVTAQGGLLPEAGGVERHGWRRGADSALLLGAVALLGLPLLAILLRGLPGLAELDGSVLRAAGRSLAVALSSAVVCVLWALGIAAGLVRLAERLPPLARAAEGAMLITLAVSPFVLAAGLFLLLRGRVDPFAIALPMVVLVNALMSLPFALRALVPALALARRTDGRLADALGLRGWTRWRVALLPRLRGPLGFSAGLAAALSMGDLGVIALFGSTSTSTLPLMVYQLMGAYRMEAAAGAALLLLTLSLALFAAFDLWGRRA